MDSTPGKNGLPMKPVMQPLARVYTVHDVTIEVDSLWPRDPRRLWDLLEKLLMQPKLGAWGHRELYFHVCRKIQATDPSQVNRWKVTLTRIMRGNRDTDWLYVMFGYLPWGLDKLHFTSSICVAQNYNWAAGTLRFNEPPPQVVVRYQ